MSIEMMQTVVIGTPLSTAILVTNEVPAGTKDGANKTYTLANAPQAGTVQLYLRGQRLEEANATDGYTRSSTTITIGSLVTAPYASDVLLADYRKA